MSDARKISINMSCLLMANRITTETIDKVTLWLLHNIFGRENEQKRWINKRKFVRFNITTKICTNIQWKYFVINRTRETLWTNENEKRKKTATMGHSIRYDTCAIFHVEKSFRATDETREPIPSQYVPLKDCMFETMYLARLSALFFSALSHIL